MNKYDWKIRRGNDPILKMICTRVERGEFVGDAIYWMEKCCKHGTTKGVGIAAPQVGFAKRIIYINCADQRGTIRGFYMWNPKVISKSAETNIQTEACLSYPGIQKRIRRHNEIEVVWDDEHWQEHRQSFVGYQSRVIQHELDHLDGICLVGDKSFAGEPTPKGNGALALAAVVGVMAMA
jgi:peptide deformylase